jgi:hypothetical protein
MKAIAAIKAFFERTDTIAPHGGRKVEMAELKGLSAGDRTELGQLACAQLGVEFQES